MFGELQAPRGVRWYLLLCGVAVVYFGVARASLWLAFEDTNASPVWPPSGIALAALLVLGIRAWPALAVGAFAANITAFAASQPAIGWRTCLVSSLIALGNSAEAATGAVLIARFTAAESFLPQLRDVLRFLLISLLACGVSACAGTLSLLALGMAPAAAGATILLTWWLGDATGMMIVTPLIVSAVAVRAQASPLTAAMSALRLALVACLAWAVFGGLSQAMPPKFLIGLALPCLALAAFRFGQLGVVSVSAVWSVVAVWKTVRSTGPFASGPLNDSLILLDTFVALCGVTGLVLAADMRERRGRTAAHTSPREIAPPWAALLGGLVLTIAAWHVIGSDTDRRAGERFTFRVSEIQRRVEERMRAYAQILRGGAGMFVASSFVSAREWKDYVAAQHLEGNFGGLQGVGFAAVVGDRSTHERELRAAGVTDYAIRPPGERDLYVAIDYLEPTNWRNQRAIGFDMWSNPTRRAAMEQARDSGDVAVTDRLILVQETSRDVQAGFLMYVPLYLHDLPITTPEQRRAALRGYVYSPFRTTDLMHAILRDDQYHLRLEIFDHEPDSASEPLYADAAPENTTLRNPYRRSVQIHVGQKQWTLRATSLPSFENEIDRQKAQIVFLGGSALSLLFFAMVRTLAQTRLRAIELAEGMTAALREAETRFSSLADATAEAIILLDGEGNVQSWNPGAASMFEQSGDALRGLHWLNLIAPRDRALLSSAWRRLAGEGGRASIPAAPSIELVGTSSRGREFPMEVSLSSWLSNGSRVYGVILRDISERQRAAEFFRGMFDEAPEAIVVTDASGRIVRANPQAARLFGYTQDELATHVVEDLLPERFRTAHRGQRSGFSRTVGRRTMGTGVELVARRADNSEFPIDVSLSQLRLSDGQLVVATIADVTERKQREAALRAAVREKETLLREVYHRVKNNMQVVSSLFNLQLRRLPEGPARQSLKEGVERLRAMSLVHEKLYQSADLSSIKLDEYLGDLSGQLGVAAGASQRRIVFTKSLEPIGIGLDVAVPLGLLVNELISNSLKHAFPENRPGEIGIVLRRDGEHVLLEVWDNGVGFADESMTERTPSMGLRLVNELASQIDGELAVEHRGGTRTRLRFKLEEPQPAAARFDPTG